MPQVVLCTCPDLPTAQKLSTAIVSEQLAACVNIIPAIRSIYRWKGEICDDAEVLMIIKSTSACFDSLQTRLLDMHPYECPEVIAIEISNGNAAYLAWLQAHTLDKPVNS
ncbi:MAG TPA: divalent-cation tolerance protein CutA [Myxococcales bacterium]|nr:divalent-cation tolerance protein CutA [Myxococcales bacterium]HIN85144.1 divalent-cation tolerance protein CutA [Myxococcales bacterium]